LSVENKLSHGIAHESLDFLDPVPSCSDKDAFVRERVEVPPEPAPHDFSLGDSERRFRSHGGRTVLAGREAGPREKWPKTLMESWKTTLESKGPSRKTGIVTA
jgi:hypothetical protein